MALPTYYPLAKNLPFDVAHLNDVFKHELRSKAEAEAYFNAFAASTILFTGTEGVDYEFDATNGFRTLTDAGSLEIVISNILAGDALKYLYFSGMSFEYELKTDEWVDVQADPNPYLHDVPELNGSPAGANANKYMFYFYNNTTAGGLHAIARDNISGTVKMEGRNCLQYLPTSNAANEATVQRPISSYNKGDFFKTRLSTEQQTLSGWMDEGLPIVPLSGGAVSQLGPQRTATYSSIQNLQYHTTGTCRLFIGNVRQLSAACTRWIRNIRLLNCPTTRNIHPMLKNVSSFGDSFSATQLGSVQGATGYPGAYNVNGWFADKIPSLYFAHELQKQGFGIGNLTGAGQGGKAFYTTLDSEGWRQAFIDDYHPSMVFTFFLHNDIFNVRTGVCTIAQLESKLMTDYILPIMQRGCHGWGFVIPQYNKYAFDNSEVVYHNQIADMLLTLPATWDAAYPEYAGKVKVRDIREEMGVDWANNPNWEYYWDGTDDIHPGNGGQILCTEQYVDMALEWLGGD